MGRARAEPEPWKSSSSGVRAGPELLSQIFILCCTTAWPNVYFKWPQKSMNFEYELELLKTILIFTPLKHLENVK